MSLLAAAGGASLRPDPHHAAPSSSSSLFSDRPPSGVDLRGPSHIALPRDLPPFDGPAQPRPHRGLPLSPSRQRGGAVHTWTVPRVAGNTFTLFGIAGAVVQTSSETRFASRDHQIRRDGTLPWASDRSAGRARAETASRREPGGGGTRKDRQRREYRLTLLASSRRIQIPSLISDTFA